jgi:hypothetical protein
MIDDSATSSAKSGGNENMNINQTPGAAGLLDFWVKILPKYIDYV